MTLLVDPRGRKTVISRRDMVFITEITAGPHPLRSCFYAVYVRAAPAVNIKLFIDADVFFFIKTHQPYLWSWKADTCDSSISLEGAEDNTDEKLLVTETQSCACIYKSDNTINGHPYLASLGTHGPLNTW